MRTMQMTGLDELSDKLALAERAAQGIAKASLYEGAGVIADAIRGSLSQIKTEPYRYANSDNKRLPSPEEKALVVNAQYGVAKHQGSGAEVNTVVGIAGDGYGMIGNKRVPVAMVLRSIQSGTSFMVAQPVVRKAINRAKGEASAKIAAEAEARLQQIFKD